MRTRYSFKLVRQGLIPHPFAFPSENQDSISKKIAIISSKVRAKVIIKKDQSPLLERVVPNQQYQAKTLISFHQL